MTRAADSSEAIRARVLTACCNADMSVAELRQYCAQDEAGSRLMKSALAQLKLARSIADVAAAERSGTAHLAEALQYRPCMGEG